MSALSFLLSALSVAIFGYSTYYMSFGSQIKEMVDLIPPPLRVYGQFKFLTYQCLLIQLLNAILHFGAHFTRVLVKPRDLVFSTLAYPVGSIVVYSFWAVWFIFGRELIFPAALSKCYPDWLNHATHTVIAPINILMAILVHHKYPSNGVLITVFYTGMYTVFLHVIKAQTGLFVYKYLDAMADTERMIYFAGTGLFAYIMYKSGQVLTALAHGGGQQMSPPKVTSKKSKQR